MKLHEIPFAEVQRIYTENANEALPLSEKEYADIISAEYMVFGRKRLGGPQAPEVTRLLKRRGEKTQNDSAWQVDSVTKTTRSHSTNNNTFRSLTS